VYRDDHQAALQRCDAMEREMSERIDRQRALLLRLRSVVQETDEIVMELIADAVRQGRQR
jgi:hypothetical protein